MMLDSNAELNEPGLEKALAELHSVLIPGETLEAWATQRRIFALTRRRTLLAATSGRLIWLVRHLVSGFDVVNLRWQDLSEVSLRVGIFAAELVIRADLATDLAINAQPGTRLININGLRKAQDQAWREKRRIRELEELRARSGGMQISQSPASATPAGSSDAVKRLQEAK